MLATQLPQLCESITSVLHLEAKGDVQWQPKKPSFFVPELHERIYRGLVEKSRTHDALVEVTYDFLTLWGPTFQEFAEHHRVFLHEICDRTIAKKNRALGGEDASIPVHSLEDERPSVAVEEVPDIRRTRLADAVLHTVEQELWHLQPTSVDAANLDT